MSELVILLLVVAAAVFYFRLRRKQREFRENRHQDELICRVTFFDSRQALPLLDDYFHEVHIRILGAESSRGSEDGGNTTTYTYRMRLPQSVEPADLVNRISGLASVKGVHIEPVKRSF